MLSIVISVNHPVENCFSVIFGFQILPEIFFVSYFMSMVVVSSNNSDFQRLWWFFRM